MVSISHLCWALLEDIGDEVAAVELSNEYTDELRDGITNLAIVFIYHHFQVYCLPCLSTGGAVNIR